MCQADSGRPLTAVDLERALDALRVVAARGAPRVAGSTAASSACSAGQPARAARASIVGAHRGVGFGQRVEAVEQRLEVEHRAADEQRHRAARADRRDRRARVGDEARRRVALGRIDDVDQVVRHRGALGRARLGGADVHAAVDQRRVDADDLDRAARRERGGDRQRGGALARRRRPGEAEVVDAGSRSSAPVSRRARADGRSAPTAPGRSRTTGAAMPSDGARRAAHETLAPRLPDTRMNLTLAIGPLVALIAGILILVVPRLLNFIVAIYLIIIGLLGCSAATSTALARWSRRGAATKRSSRRR